MHPPNTEDQQSQWKFSQCFGDKTDTIDVAEADLISAVEFDKSGDYLASGDRAGRIVLFQRNYSKRGCEYRFLTEFQSHEPEFDYLKSLEINEKINQIVWCRRTNDSHFLFTTNDKTIKLWRVKERSVQAVVENNLSVAQKLVATDVRIPLMLPRMVERNSVIAASPRRQFLNGHAYHIHSISMNSDEETLLSSDDLRVNLWNVNHPDVSFNVVDLKPASIEELTEVITTARFHPKECNIFAFGTSKGMIRLCDMRSASLCDRNAITFKASPPESAPSNAFFGELISSISSLSFSPTNQYHMATRDYMTLKIWDIRREGPGSGPLISLPVHDGIRPKLCDLYENDNIFDKFECSFNYNGSLVMTGSYSNILRFTPLASPTQPQFLQADKSIFRNNTAHSSSRSTSKLLSSSSSKSQSSLGSVLDDVRRSGEVDFDRKIIHASLHPKENTVALAALSNLFIFTTQNNSHMGSTTSVVNTSLKSSTDLSL